MKNAGNRGIWVVGAVLFTGAFVSVVRSHCQVPCGIYDDQARLNAIAENTTTVEKAMKQIEELSGQPKPNMNQIVRWVNVKELHADDTAEIITYYFMAQRIKPAAKTDGAAYDKYIRQLTLLHDMLITSMKTKQSTDAAEAAKLRTLLADFSKEYMGEQPHEHSH